MSDIGAGSYHFECLKISFLGIFRGPIGHVVDVLVSLKWEISLSRTLR